MLRRLASRFQLLDQNIRLLVASFFPASAAGWMLDATLPLYLKSMGLSMAGIGGIFTVDALLAAVFSAPAGWMADRYNRARVQASATLVLCVASLILLAPASVYLILVYLVLSQLGANVAWTSRYSLTLDLVEREKRGGVFGLFHTLAYALPIGAGVMLGGLLTLGFSAVFLLVTILRLAAFLVRIRIRDPRRTQSARDAVPPRQVSGEATLRAAFLSPRAAMRSFASDMVDSFAVFARQRDLLALLALTALGSLGVGLSMRYFVIYFTSVLGFSYLLLGSLLSVHAVGFGLGGFVGGLVSDRVGRRRTLVLSSVISGVATFALVCVRGPALVAAVYFLIAFASSAWPVAFQVLMGELCPESHRGRFFAVADVTSTAALGLGPLLGGWLWTFFGPPAVFMSDAGISILCGALLMCTGGRDNADTAPGEM